MQSKLSKTQLARVRLVALKKKYGSLKYGGPLGTKVIGNAVQHAGIKVAYSTDGLLGLAEQPLYTDPIMGADPTATASPGKNRTRLELLADDVLTSALRLSQKVR